jgi:deoxyribodipyrimidine photo-lyase
MQRTPPAIVWFRQDLRVTDNPALTAAADTGNPVLPVYILDDANAGDWKMGAASRWWLHLSLRSLNASLDGHLRFLRGDALELLTRLADRVNAAGIFWNRCYEPWRIDRDRRIKTELKNNGRAVASFNGSLLFEPRGVPKADGSPYKAYTPFYRKGCLGDARPPRIPLSAPTISSFDESPLGHELDELALMPSKRWYDGIAEAWKPGEAGALERLERFLDEGVRNYKEDRNRPDLENVSRLSPHFHFGEISSHQVWHAANSLKAIGGLENDIDYFLSELGWREFSYSLLYHWPALPHNNLQGKFDRFPRRDYPVSLKRWQRGQRGYPIVDAGMRELWKTGYMHNRVRMIVGSLPSQEPAAALASW